MAEFVKDLSRSWVLASGVTQADMRSGSIHFDQRAVTPGSGVQLLASGADARTYVAEGSYKLADYWPIQLLASGTLRVQTPYSMQTGPVYILNEQGEEVIAHEPSPYTRRDLSSTTATVNDTGTYYMYVTLNGRRSCEYRGFTQIDGSTAGN